MNAPLTLLNLNAPVATASSAPARSSDQGSSSFSDVMAQQRAAQDDPKAAANDAQGASNPAPPAAKPGGQDAARPVKAAAGDKDEDKDAGATAAAPAAPTLPQQALAIAAMAAQLQAAPAVAAAAAAATPAAPASSAAPVAATSANAAAAADPSQTLATALAAGPTVPGAAATPPAANPAPASTAPATAADNPLAAAAADLPAIAASVNPQNQPAATLPTAPKGAPASPQAAKARAALTPATNTPYQATADDSASATTAGTKAAAADALPPAIHTGSPANTGADAQPSKDNADAGPGPLAAALSAATQAPVTVTQGNAAPSPHVATPVGDAAWGEDLGRQMVVMTQNLKQNTHTAELRLDPPDLGPLRVMLTLSDGVAQASFVSSHAAVRQAVEAALPQLQQALSQAGISLGQTNVGDQGAQAGFMASQQGDGRQGQAGGNNANGGGAANADAGINTVQLTVDARRASDALVDTFA